MQARSVVPTASHFVRGDKVIIVSKNIFLRRQPNRKMCDRRLGPFAIEEHIGKHSYILKSRPTVCLRPFFHVNNLRPCSTASLRPTVHVTTPDSDDDEIKVSQISAVCIKSLPRRRGKYLLFMTHFRDDDIPHVGHRLSEVHRTTTLHDFPETSQWCAFA
jgi:hypothetical protein